MGWVSRNLLILWKMLQMVEEDMDLVYRTFAEYYYSNDFRRFQNDLSKEIYESLAGSYSNAYNEVAMVTEMCELLNGKAFGKLKFYSHKIHGTRSFVEFFNQDKPVTTELADMAIICVATKNRNIVFEKLSFVQNKKENKPDSWKIDPDQLYLLRNFPTLTGKKGFFKRNDKDTIVFMNHSGNLGTYGLFQGPGEMILANARTIYGVQAGNQVSYNDLKKQIDTVSIKNPLSWPFLGLKFYSIYELPYLPLPFLNNNSNSLNVYDFIRNWTFFNIGEVCSIGGHRLDQDLSELTKVLLREAGLSNEMNIQTEQNSFDSNLITLIAHLNLDKKE